MNPPSLRDNVRTLVLTGASRGIGHATVKKFGANGWRIITISRQPFSALCPWPGGGENHVQLDLADPVDIGRGKATHPAIGLDAAETIAGGTHPDHSVGRLRQRPHGARRQALRLVGPRTEGLEAVADRVI